MADIWRERACTLSVEVSQRFHYGYNEVKSFSGKELSFDEFKEQYPNAEFEIVTEGYCGYDITFQGYIWQAENDSLFGIIRIWNIGDMIYRI